MKEVMEVFEEAPFKLNPEDRELLARYIVEDAQGQYIYCDEENEQKREVAKAILKSLLTEYELCSEEIKEQYGQFLNNYSNNILNALKTIAPSGKVSMKKFM